MNLEALQQRILNSDNSDAEKARLFVKNKTAKQLTLPQWQILVDNIPDGVMEAIAELLESPGTGPQTSQAE